MGRCQGGYCMPRLTAIIAEETGLSPDEILLSDEGSEILTEKRH